MNTAPTRHNHIGDPTHSFLIHWPLYSYIAPTHPADDPLGKEGILLCVGLARGTEYSE